MDKLIKVFTWIGLACSLVGGLAGGATAACKMKQFADQCKNSDTNTNVEA